MCPPNYELNPTARRCDYPLAAFVYGSPLPPPQRCEGNPCDVASGDKYQAETDYRGPSLAFARFYHSLVQEDTAVVGVGWSHEYGDRLLLANGAPQGVLYGSGYQEPLVGRGGDHFTPSARGRVEVRRDPAGWALYRADGGRDLFDAAGRLARRERPGHPAVEVVRDPATARIARVQDPFGRALVFEYDPPTGHLSAIFDPADQRIGFRYDGAGNLVQVDYPDGRSRRYHYEDGRFPNALTGITDENGDRFATYGYDALGRAASSEHAGGAGRIGLSYTSATTVATDALGSQRVYDFSPYNLVTLVVEQCPDCGAGLRDTYAYGAGLNVASRIDRRGNATYYGHDGVRHLETSRTEAAGTAQARTITTQWHPTFRLPVRIAEPGQRTDFVYDERGNLLNRTETALDTGATRVWRYTRDGYGQILTADGPRTDVVDVTAYEYWPSDARCPGADEGPGMDEGCRGQLRRATDAAGHATEYLKYDAHGQLLRRRDPNGAERFYAYDARQRPISRDEAGLVTAYRYDPRGLLDQITLPGGAVLSYRYDAAHRLIGIRDNLGNRVSYTLDPAGNRLKEQLYDPAGTLARQIDREFDALSRMRRETLGARP